MSYNFELMSQLEVELREVGNRASAATSRVAVMPTSPVNADEAFKEETLRLVQRVFLSPNGSVPRQVVFCGVDGDSASSSVCACTAQTLAAKSAQSVCVVDGIIRSPRLADIFGVNTTTAFTGTSESLRGQCVKVDSNLWLAGPDVLADDSRVLLPTDDLKKRVAELQDMFGYVLIDAPGIRVCGDAEQLGQIAGAVILVVEANSTRRQTARNAKEALDAAGVRLLGTVLHNRSFPIPEKLYKRL
jgi:Mrp family chromosome partitioning ATPase